MYVCTVCMYVCMDVCVYVCIFVCMFICINTQIHVHERMECSMDMYIHHGHGDGQALWINVDKNLVIPASWLVWYC